MSNKKDPRIDSYLSTLPAWQTHVCNQIRTLIHEADPDVEETIKRTKLPFFTLQGNICTLMGTKDHVNIFIYDPIAPDLDHLINQGHKNTTARAIQIYENDVLNEKALLKFFTEIMKNNQAGGWRAIKKNR